MFGLGTVGVAALRSGRRFIGIEKDKDTYQKALMRLHRELEN
jgi:DNA modification methylase